MLAGAERRLRRYADDTAPAGLAHRRYRGARHQEGPARVDAHRAIPGLERHVFDLVAVGALWCAGIVDEDIEPAVAAEHLLHHAIGIRLDADIAERCGGSSAAARKLLDEAVDAAPRAIHVAFDIVLVGNPGRHDIGNDDRHTGGGKGAGGRIADADRLSAAGDQRNTGGTRHTTSPRNSIIVELTAPIPQNRHSSHSPLGLVPARRPGQKFEAVSMRKSIAVVLCSLLAVAAAPGAPRAQADDKPNGELPARVATHHTIGLNGRQLDYEAVAETLPVTDAKGNTTASIFTVSYVTDGENGGGRRPISFVFNGGPGAASVFLHLGALGPQI